VGLRDEHVAPALLLIVLGAFALITPAQNDTFWHLRSGREMWETGWFLTMEPFSHTSHGTPLHNHWWLSQLAFYGVFALGGPVLVTAFAGGCALAAVWGSWRLTRGRMEGRIVLLAFLLLATAPEWAVRPQVISLALLVVMAHLITSGRIIWLPVVCLVWANAHAMVIFGVVMAAACALEAVVWSRRFLLRDALVAVACAAAPTISPLGWQYWPRVLETVSVSRELRLDEYQPAIGSGSAVFWVAVAALAIIVVKRPNAVHDSPRDGRILLIAAAILAVAAITATRNIAFFAVIAAPAVSTVWFRADTPARRVRHAGVAGYVLVGATAVAAVVFVGLRWNDGGRALGWRPMSPGVIAAVRKCDGPLFNHFEDGGYLMWSVPEKRVFVDSRVEAYAPDFLRRSRSADLFGEYRDLFAEYRIACAVIAKSSPLHARLMVDPQMALTYSDGSRSVFVRRGQVSADSGQ
jgi:hypothetical protein